jgi:hypothetical protein
MSYRDEQQALRIEVAALTRALRQRIHAVKLTR